MLRHQSTSLPACGLVLLRMRIHLLLLLLLLLLLHAVCTAVHALLHLQGRGGGNERRGSQGLACVEIGSCRHVRGMSKGLLLLLLLRLLMMMQMWLLRKSRCCR